MTRSPKFAGQFYPMDARELSKTVDCFLNFTQEKQEIKNLRGLIVPHAGYIFSGIIAGAGYGLLQKMIEKPKLIILLGPSHQYPISQPTAADFEKWETPLGTVKTDLKALRKLKSVKVINVAHQDEHSLEVQLPFLQRVLNDFKIVPILLNTPSDKKFIQELISLLNKEVLIIVSSDLSHYLPYDEAVALDNLANQAIPALDVEFVSNQVSACGREAIITLMEIARQLKWQGVFFDYKNSGDTFGDKDRVVGYGCYGFFGD